MYLRTLIAALSLHAIVVAQNPGDSVFTTNQVMEIDLQFSQVGFWDSLVANYATETYMMADVTITDIYGAHTYDSIGVRLKGNSSYGHPGNKKSFKIDFNRYVDGQEYDGLRKLNFNNCFKDPTFMREKIYYDICRDANINAPRCNYANVYMNGTLWGFYSVVEQIDDEWLKTHFDENNEHLYKAGDAFGGGPGGAVTSADLLDYGADTTEYTDRYTMENNADENDWTDLMQLTDFINNTSDADFAEGLDEHFDVPNLMRCFVMYNLFVNLDSYLNSARNFYLYNYDSTGVWEWINWDCNEAFGLYPAGPGVTDATTLQTDFYVSDRPLYERILTIADTRATYDYYYCELYNTYMISDYVDNLIDELYTLIQSHVLADPNKMYTSAQFETNIDEDITGGGGPGGGTIYGLRSFVESRISYLDGLMDCSDINTINESSLAPTLSVYPNPAHAFIQLQLSGNMDMSAISSISISDATGRLLMQMLPQQTIDISVLPAGVYVLTVEGEYARESVQLIKL